MIIISVSEFRNNIKKYLDMANAEILIVNRGKEGSFAVVPFEEIKNEPDFIAKKKLEIIEAIDKNTNK